MRHASNMEYTSPLQYAGKILRLTRRMYVLAKQGDWLAVSGIEAERQITIESLFLHPQISTSLAQLADMLWEVIEVDRQCILLGEDEKQASSSRLVQLHHGKQAVMSYLDHTR